MKLIVGLGNPGKQYENTRHNIGFMVLDNYLKNEKWGNKFNAMYVEKNINGEKVFFVKPLTFMNNSGNAVGEFVRYFDILASDILVIQDDLDLAVGNYKLKVHSSSGGHNGIKSIISCLDNQDIPRLKVGIGSVNKDQVIDYVLGKFNKIELETINILMPTFLKIIDSFIIDGIDKTMNVYNTK